MPLMPKRVKYRKQQRGSRAGTATSGTELAFGGYGLKSLDRGWVTNVQIEACRVAINRHMKRRGKSGCACFRTNRSPRNLQRHEWEAVKVLRNSGLQW